MVVQIDADQLSWDDKRELLGTTRDRLRSRALAWSGSVSGPIRIERWREK